MANAWSQMSGNVLSLIFSHPGNPLLRVPWLAPNTTSPFSPAMETPRQTRGLWEYQKVRGSSSLGSWKKLISLGHKKLLDFFELVILLKSLKNDFRTPPWIGERSGLPLTSGQTPGKEWNTRKSSRSLENWTLTTPSPENALIFQDGQNQLVRCLYFFLWFPNLAPPVLTESHQLWEPRTCVVLTKFWADCVREHYLNTDALFWVCSLWNVLWIEISDGSSHPSAFSMRLAFVQTGNKRENTGEGGLPEDTVTLRWDWLLPVCLLLAGGSPYPSVSAGNVLLMCLPAPI